MRNIKMRVLVLSILLTTGLGTVMADTGIRLMVPDLPFAFSGMASFNLHLQVEQSVQEHTEGILTFESCGQELTLGYQGELKKELLTPVALVPGLQYFPIEVKDQLERDCDLHFHLWDKKKETLLATTGIGLKYKSCYAPIDADQELILSGHLADLPQDDQHASR
ncbi:MAG: hypothetical protein Q4B28_00800 [bacterium]|nr:hypothetical protein [bacterium]